MIFLGKGRKSRPTSDGPKLSIMIHPCQGALDSRSLSPCAHWRGAGVKLGGLRPPAGCWGSTILEVLMFLAKKPRGGG